MRRVFCLGCVWITTLVLAAGISWHWRGQDPAVGAEVSVAAATAQRSMPPSSTGLESIDDGIATDEATNLREELADLEAKHNALSKQYFMLSLEKWAAENDTSGTDSETINALWDSQLTAMQIGGNVFDFESRFALMYAFASYGDKGVVHLRGILDDRSRTDFERETALLVLRYMASPRALEAVLSFRDPELTELDYPYDLMNTQLKMIESDAIRHRFPEILARIDQELGADTLAPERAEVLLTLASTHGDTRARQLLLDPRIYHENLGGAITLAATLNTAVADEFLLNIAQYHEDQHYRRMARRYYGQ